MNIFSAANLKNKVQERKGTAAPVKANVFGTKTDDDNEEVTLLEKPPVTQTSPLEESTPPPPPVVTDETPVTEEGTVEPPTEQAESTPAPAEPTTAVMPDLGKNVPQPPPPLYEETMATENHLHEEPKEFTTEPSLGDSGVFQRLAQSTQPSDGVDTYAELVESMVSQQCQLSGVKNLDLTTFGLRAQVLAFPNLSVMTYGIHKFLGAPFTEEEENMIIHRLGLHVAQSDKSKVVVRAVKEIKDARGMSFYSLLFNDKIAQRFANVFNYTVHANTNEADVSKLVLVIQK